LGPGPRLTKKNLQGRGLTKVEKHCLKPWVLLMGCTEVSQVLMAICCTQNE